MHITVEIDNCEECSCLDAGEAWHSRFYCDHADAPKDAEGNYICFNIDDGIPEWCPRKRVHNMAEELRHSDTGIIYPNGEPTID